MAPESSRSAISRGKQPIRRSPSPPPTPRPAKRIRSGRPSGDDFSVDKELQNAVDAAAARAGTPPPASRSTDYDVSWETDSDSQDTPSTSNEDSDLEDRANRYSEIIRNFRDAAAAAKRKKDSDRADYLNKKKRKVEKVFQSFQLRKKDGVLPEQREAQRLGKYITWCAWTCYSQPCRYIASRVARTKTRCTSSGVHAAHFVDWFGRRPCPHIFLVYWVVARSSCPYGAPCTSTRTPTCS